MKRRHDNICDGKAKNGKVETVEKSQIFTGMSVLIVPNGIGKKRLSLLQDKVVLHGGRLVSSFEEGRLTHVIVDDVLPIEGFKKFVEDEARVAGIPVLKTQWLSRCLAENAIIPLGEYQILATPNVHPTVQVGTSLDHPHEEQTKEVSINKVWIIGCYPALVVHKLVSSIFFCPF